MIGNDLVDLVLAGRESNWQRKGFIEKIFSEKEQKVILKNSNAGLLVWRLWSMKESAYKAHQRRFSLLRKFNPRDFRCEVLSSIKGTVVIQGYNYLISTDVLPELIYSEAVAENQVFHLHTSLRTEVSSEEIKRESLQEFRRFSNNNVEFLHIKKDDKGVPFFSSKRKIFDTPISFTHHGKFSAFTIALPYDQ